MERLYELSTTMAQEFIMRNITVHGYSVVHAMDIVLVTDTIVMTVVMTIVVMTVMIAATYHVIQYKR